MTDTTQTILFILIGLAAISQLFPSMGYLNAKLLRGLADLQQRHSTAMSAAYSTYLTTWNNYGKTNPLEASDSHDIRTPNHVGFTTEVGEIFATEGKIGEA